VCTSFLQYQYLLHPHSTYINYRTNRDDALSPLGVEQVCTAMNEMMLNDINPSVVKYSLAAKSIDTANLVANEMQVSSVPSSARESINWSSLLHTVVV